ncbi:MAG: ferrous iron transporter B [Phycisphaerales bacterium]|nr:ferrous iron transporter B [Phycisphaerales bacterium]
MSSVDAAPIVGSRIVALLGNPNVGKTTLFNRIVGLRAKTSNFPGTTQEARHARLDGSVLVDLPGVYSLNLDMAESVLCRQTLSGETAPAGVEAEVPNAVLVVIDATNLVRNLAIVAEAIALRLPTVVAVNMIDLANRRGIHIDLDRLSECLGCTVVGCSGRTGEGVDELVQKLESARIPDRSAPSELDAIDAWSDDIYSLVASACVSPQNDRITDRLDRAFTHPLVGVLTFVAVMTGLFWVIFQLATVPMDLIDAWFGTIGGWVGSVLPEGAIRDLLVDGMIAGIGGTVIFLPQIVLLFFLLALLEGTGYLARAAFVIDRVLRPFGMSGHSFVPLLSSHACAIPGIMACRSVPDPKDRLATILVAPFMSCTARIPVYVLLTVILFPDSPAMQAVAFTGCYVIGALAGLMSSLVARRTILKGASRPMAMELPSYRFPDLKAAFMLTYDRAVLFLRKAGTLIVAVSIVLWWLGAYPHADTPQESVELRQQAVLSSDSETIASLESQADLIEARHASAQSFLGRIGSTVQPVFEPLGYDRQLTVGVLASFAAREVFVSTMAVQVVGSDDTEDDGVLSSIANAKRDDGSLVFTRATSWSLLMYYILAMLCLPTVVVTAKEAGGWKWAWLQLGWMTLLAYGGAMIAFQAVSLLS